jgi:hypothetical protein
MVVAIASPRWAFGARSKYDVWVDMNDDGVIGAAGVRRNHQVFGFGNSLPIATLPVEFDATGECGQAVQLPDAEGPQ